MHFVWLWVGAQVCLVVSFPWGEWEPKSALGSFHRGVVGSPSQACGVLPWWGEPKAALECALMRGGRAQVMLVVPFYGVSPS